MNIPARRRSYNFEAYQKYAKSPTPPNPFPQKHPKNHPIFPKPTNQGESRVRPPDSRCIKAPPKASPRPRGFSRGFHPHPHLAPTPHHPQNMPPHRQRRTPTLTLRLHHPQQAASHTLRQLRPVLHIVAPFAAARRVHLAQIQQLTPTTRRLHRPHPVQTRLQHTPATPHHALTPPRTPTPHFPHLVHRLKASRNPVKNGTRHAQRQFSHCALCAITRTIKFEKY